MRQVEYHIQKLRKLPSLIARKKAVKKERFLAELTLFILTFFNLFRFNEKLFILNRKRRDERRQALWKIHWFSSSHFSIFISRYNNNTQASERKVNVRKDSIILTWEIEQFLCWFHVLIVYLWKSFVNGIWDLFGGRKKIENSYQKSRFFHWKIINCLFSLGWTTQRENERETTSSFLTWNFSHSLVVPCIFN
jgi:hypothetical protein